MAGTQETASGSVGGKVAHGAPPPLPPTDALNADDASAVMKELLDALQAMRRGDFSVRMPGDQTGLAGKIADTFNDIVAANQRMAQQLERVGQVVGREGKTRQRVTLRPVERRLGATWRARSTR